MVGASCALLNNILIIVFARQGAHYLTAALLAFAPVVALGFSLHTFFTFDCPPTPGSFLRYAVAMAANFPIWSAAMFLLCNLLAAPVAIASPAATLVSFLWNYSASHWALATRGRAGAAP